MRLVSELPGSSRAVVIGAGAAGLAAAAALTDAGVEALILERGEQVGASWHARYDRLRLNTTRRLSSLPGKPIPSAEGRWVGRERFAAYLRAYACERVGQLALGVEVTELRRGDAHWLVGTDKGAMAADVVVVATGSDRHPVLPDWAGAARFPGRLVHSSEYRNARPFAGRRVLVAGAGTSGNEIATDLVEGGARSVHVAVRSRPTTFPRQWGHVPVPTLTHLTPGRPADRVLDGGGRLLERLVWGDLARLGLPRPRWGIATSLRRSGHGIAIDGGLIGHIRGGRATVVPAVLDLDRCGAVLTDGRRLAVDDVVAATGFRCALEPLLGQLPGVLRPDGRPGISGAEQAPGAPGLHTIGFRLPVSGQLPEIGRDARAIARRVSGQRALAPCRPAESMLARAWADALR